MLMYLILLDRNQARPFLEAVYTSFWGRWDAFQNQNGLIRSIGFVEPALRGRSHVIGNQ